MEVLSKARNADTVGAATVAGVNAVIEEWLVRRLYQSKPLSLALFVVYQKMHG
jgi:hypothetical protein